MKIGFVGNMNNYNVPIAFEFRRRGYDVRLIVDSDYGLHRPETRFDPSEVAYGDWVFDLAPFRLRDVVLPTARRRRMLALLADRDLLIASGLGIAISSLLDIPCFIIGAGSDVDLLGRDPAAVRRGQSSLQRLRGKPGERAERRQISMQRDGFRRSLGVGYCLPGVLPRGDALMRAAGIGLDRHVHMMTTDLDRITPSPTPAAPDGRLRLLSIPRLVWHEPLPPGFSDLDNKRTDLMLAGVAEYRRRGHEDFVLRLPTKGDHLAQTRALVTELGLDNWIAWLDELRQSEFLDEMRCADVILDQFGPGSIGMGARDAMAIGRPVIAHWKAPLFDSQLGEPLPAIDAVTPDTIADGLERLSDADERARLGKAARTFAERHFSAQRAADVILAAFARSGKRAPAHVDLGTGDD